VAQLCHERPLIDELGLSVLVVTFEEPWLAKLYAEEVQLPWPLLLDPERDLYRRYGMERASLATVMGPSSWWGYSKLLLRGRKLKAPTGDVRQLGGDVLIDPGGMIRLHHVTQTPIDRPDPNAIFDVVRKATTAKSSD